MLTHVQGTLTVVVTHNSMRICDTPNVQGRLTASRGLLLLLLLLLPPRTKNVRFFKFSALKKCPLMSAFFEPQTSLLQQQCPRTFILNEHKRKPCRTALGKRSKCKKCISVHPKILLRVTFFKRGGREQSSAKYNLTLFEWLWWRGGGGAQRVIVT